MSTKGLDHSFIDMMSFSDTIVVHAIEDHHACHAIISIKCSVLN